MLYILLLFAHLLPAAIPIEVGRLVDRHSFADSAEAASLTLLPFEREIDSVADVYHITPSLLAAIIQEESRFAPYATRYEPRYERQRSVRLGARKWANAHHNVPTYQTELSDRSRSMGLMQVMGETAREQGFRERYLAELYDPRAAIEQGATLLSRLLKRYHQDTLAAISAYNQGDARKHRGVFVNARYVYRVAIAWHAYAQLLKR